MTFQDLVIVEDLVTVEDPVTAEDPMTVEDLVTVKDLAVFEDLVAAPKGCPLALPAAGSVLHRSIAPTTCVLPYVCRP